MYIIKKICDRCKKEIEDTNHWTINIYEQEDKYGMHTATGAVNNMYTNSNLAFGKEEIYCRDCIDEILKFIKNR